MSRSQATAGLEETDRMRLLRRYSPEITVLGLLVTLVSLIPARNMRLVDWPLVVLVLIVILGLFCMVVAGGWWIRAVVGRKAAKKAARDEAEREKAAEKAKAEREKAAEKKREESLVRVFRDTSISALDLRRLYQGVKEEDVDIDDQSNERRQALVTRTLKIRKVFEGEFGIATPPLIDEKLESFNYQGWMDYLEELIVFMERGALEGARQRFPLNQPWVPGPSPRG